MVKAVSSDTAFNYFFKFFIYLMTSRPAIAPSWTALAICSIPPVQSPAAYKPGRLVAIRSFTAIFLPFNVTPSFLAKSALPATPIATNRPFIFCSAAFSNSIESMILFPFILLILAVFTLIDSGTEVLGSFPSVSKVTDFATGSKTCASCKA